MVEIIPAILTDSDEELARVVHVLECAEVKRAQLDICDGMFVPTRTITGFEQLRRLITEIRFDVHLMVRAPELHCPNWYGVANAVRLLVHVEATKNFGELCEHAREHGAVVGAVINPETPLGRLEEAVAHTNFVQFMTVHPGKQGREFVPAVLERMRQFHAAHPNVKIIADGGITPATAPQCVAAGASTLVSGSYIFHSVDIAKAIQQLRAAVVQ